MDEIKLEMKKRAWEMAHKLVTLGKVVKEREEMDMLSVGTAEFCRAMGKPEGAKLEEVRDFVIQVTDFMRGFGMYLVCGCGYLAISVCPERTRELAIEEDRELTAFTPPSVDEYFNDYLLNADNFEGEPVRQICEIGENEKE